MENPAKRCTERNNHTASSEVCEILIINLHDTPREETVGRFSQASCLQMRGWGRSTGQAQVVECGGEPMSLRGEKPKTPKAPATCKLRSGNFHAGCSLHKGRLGFGGTVQLFTDWYSYIVIFALLLLSTAQEAG